jgi:hypothetical protein
MTCEVIRQVRVIRKLEGRVSFLEHCTPTWLEQNMRYLGGPLGGQGERADEGAPSRNSK